jgi:hypothetical protein
MQSFLMRYRRYRRHRLSQFALALAVWREYTNASVKLPLLSKLTPYQRATLEDRFAEVEGALAAPREEVAACVAAMYSPDGPRPDVRLVETATRQVRELVAEAEKYEYVFGAAKWLPHTAGLVAPKIMVTAFNEWYVREFHGEAEMARQRALTPAPVVPYHGGSLVYSGPHPAVEVEVETGVIVVRHGEATAFPPAIAASLVQQDTWTEHGA